MPWKCGFYDKCFLFVVVVVVITRSLPRDRDTALTAIQVHAVNLIEIRLGERWHPISNPSFMTGSLTTNKVECHWLVPKSRLFATCWVSSASYFVVDIVTNSEGFGVAKTQKQLIINVCKRRSKFSDM